MPLLRIGAAERRDAPPAHAREGPDRVLHFLRIDVAPAADHDVLDPAGEVHLAVGHVGAVAGIEPVAVEEAPRLARVAEIALRRRRSPEFQPTLDALVRLLATERVDDADLVPRHRAPAGDEPQCGRVLGRGGLGPAVARERLAANAVDARPAAQRRDQEAHGALGQAVHRRHRLGPEAVGREALAESPHRFRDHRLGAVGRQAQRSQVERPRSGHRRCASRRARRRSWARRSRVPR